MTQLEWDGADALSQRMGTYGNLVMEAIQRVALYWAPIIEAEAKANAPWTDRTGQARQGLRGFVQDLSETVVAIYLVHQKDYGVYLELARQGRYAIIMPTLERHYQPIADMLRRIF
jgi:hypothetical protein